MQWLREREAGESAARLEFPMANVNSFNPMNSLRWESEARRKLMLRHWLIFFLNLANVLF